MRLLQILQLSSFCAKVARAPGLEPRPKVLETLVLPLNYARVCITFL